MDRRDLIHHLESLAVVVLFASILYIDITREIPVKVDVDVDASPVQEAGTQLISEVDRLSSLQELYQLNLNDLRSLSTCGALDRLSSETAIVGRVFYIGGEPFYYYVSLKEYKEADFNALVNCASEIDKTYIRPLTPDIEFLARQFVQRYPDKTERALAILTLIQNIGYDSNEAIKVKHPTVTLMQGGTCIDLAIACGALLRAADIRCALLIFRCQLHAAVGIADIDFGKLCREIGEKSVIDFEGTEYLICETTSLRHPAGDSLSGNLGAVDSDTVTLVIPYEFP